MVYYSTVVAVNAANELKTFKLLLASLPDASLIGRRTCLQNAVVLTQVAEKVLVVREFRDICRIVSRNDLSIKKNKEQYAG
jgi:hypothetical protein